MYNHKIFSNLSLLTLPKCKFSPIESGFLLSSSFKGGSLYLAKFTICGFLVKAAGFEFPEGVVSVIEIWSNPDSIAVTLGPLKEGTIHLAHVCSSISHEGIPILHYQYPCLGIYEWINPNSKQFKLVIGSCIIILINIINLCWGLLEQFFLFIKQVGDRKGRVVKSNYKWRSAAGTEAKRIRERNRNRENRAKQKKNNSGGLLLIN